MAQRARACNVTTRHALSSPISPLAEALVACCPGRAVFTLLPLLHAGCNKGKWLWGNGVVTELNLEQVGCRQCSDQPFHPALHTGCPVGHTNLDGFPTGERHAWNEGAPNASHRSTHHHTSRTSADRIHGLLQQRQHRLGRLVNVVQQQRALPVKQEKLQALSRMAGRECALCCSAAACPAGEATQTSRR